MSTTENTPDVSVVIATKNRCQWLARAVESALSQQFVSLEVIVVNDASEDDTAAWLAGQNAPNFHAINLPQPAERIIARNTGLARARGRWIQFLDDDDRLRPDALSKLLQAAESRTGIGSAVGNRCHDFGEGSPRNYDESHARRASIRTIWPELVFGWSAVSGQNLYRTSLVREVGGYSGSIPCEDRDLWLRIAYAAPTAIIPEVTLDYRQHDGQIRPANLAEIREQKYSDFAAKVSPSDREKCVRLRRACHAWDACEKAFELRDRASLRRNFLPAISAAPELLFSPLTGQQRRDWAKRIARRILTGWK